MRALRALINELGFIDAVWYVLCRILEGVSARRIRLVKYYTYCQPLIKQRTGRGKSIQVLLADAQYENIFSAPRGREVILSRLRQGSQCLLAEKEQLFLGFIWLHPDEYYEDEVRCHYDLLPRGNYAWDYDVYVAPEARISYAFSRLWEEASEHLARQGRSATISRIDAFNARSIRSHERLGAKRIGSLLFICVGRCQLMLGTHAPYLHLSCSSVSEPVVKIHVPPDKL